MFRKYIKTWSNIDISVANVWKHVIQLTLFLPMCQNTSYDLHYFCQCIKTRRSIDIKLSFWNNFCEYPWGGLQNASNAAPEATFAHVHSWSPNSFKLTSWDHLWPRCRSKDFAFGVHRWGSFECLKRDSCGHFCTCPQPKPQQLKMDFLRRFMTKTPSKYDTPLQHVRRILVWGTPLGSLILGGQFWANKPAGGRRSHNACLFWYWQLPIKKCMIENTP